MTLAEAIQQARALEDEPDSPSRRARAERHRRFFSLEVATNIEPARTAASIVAHLAGAPALL